MRIIPRSEWGARYGTGFGNRRVGSLAKIGHHSVTVAPDLVPPYTDDYEAIRVIERIGQQRFGRGISYSFLVTPAGLVFEGVPIGRIGAHTSGLNTTGVGICFVGNYQTDTPSEQMLDAGAWLLRHGVEKGWWETAKFQYGHRDVSSTACPGNRLYPLLDEMGRRAALLDAAPASKPTPAPAPKPPTTAPKGDPVMSKLPTLDWRKQQVRTRIAIDRRVQGLLAAAGAYRGKLDGYRGPQSLAALRSFQIATNSGNGRGGADMYIGQRTWESLLTGKKW